MADELSIRRATADDADEMACLRRDMQAELLTTGDRGLAVDAASPRQNRDYFREKLPAGEFVAFLAETGGVIAGTSGMVVYRAPPTQGNPTGVEGYIIMNMYTVPAYRGRGIVTRLLERLVEHARSIGARRVWLRASDLGRPVYARFGFGDDPHYMSYRLPETDPQGP